MDKNNISISINGNEKNKNEIIYNNILDSMDEKNISKDEQIEYLKSKVANLESEVKNKINLSLTIIIGFICLVFGIYLMYVNQKLIGTIFITTSFITVVILLLRMIRKYNNVNNSKYSEVDRLKSILNSRLK